MSNSKPRFAEVVSVHIGHNTSITTGVELRDFGSDGEEVLISAKLIDSSLGSSLFRDSRARADFMEVLYAENPDIRRVHLHYSGFCDTILDRLFDLERHNYYLLCRIIDVAAIENPA